MVDIEEINLLPMAFRAGFQQGSTGLNSGQYLGKYSM